MICVEDPFRRRPRKSTARSKRREGCVWMTKKLAEWPSKRGPISKIRSSDGCGRDAVLLAVERWYDFLEFGGYLGNVITIGAETCWKILRIFILPADIVLMIPSVIWNLITSKRMAS